MAGVDSRARVFIRPESVELRPRSEGAGAADNGLPGRVVQVVFGGSVVMIEVATDSGRRLDVERPSGSPGAAYEVGDTVVAVLPSAAIRVLDGTD
jgi:ABC-type Fe3+/spermidine/putrescine transport system ATPase subunit